MAKSSTAPSAITTTAFSASPIGIKMSHARSIRKEGAQNRLRYPSKSLSTVQTLKFVHTAAERSGESVVASKLPAFVGEISAMIVMVPILRDHATERKGYVRYFDKLINIHFIHFFISLSLQVGFWGFGEIGRAHV